MDGEMHYKCYSTIYTGGLQHATSSIATSCINYI